MSRTSNKTLALVLLVMIGGAIVVVNRIPLMTAIVGSSRESVGTSKHASGNKSLRPTGADHSPQIDQATQIRTQLNQGVAHFRSLPFRPEHGDEFFDDTKTLSESEQEKWQRHCRLRDAYASEHIREPAFVLLHALAKEFNLDNDLDKLSYLNDIAYDLTVIARHTSDYSPELVSNERQENLKELLQKEIATYQRIITNIFQTEINGDFMTALLEIHPKGGIGDPSTHIEPGERIILN